MTAYPLAHDGVFWTLQGEGAQSGEPMAFVRLAGCSVGCAQCDTEYGVSRRVTAEQLVREISAVVPAAFVHPWVWLTGGEPTDHDLTPLIDLLKTVGFRVAVATAGVRKLSVTCLPDWVSVSPHFLNVVQKFGHELKVVPGLNGLTWDAVETIDREWHSFPWRYIQPLAGSPESVQQCAEFVLAHPGWRLTAQAHKTWGLK